MDHTLKISKNEEGDVLTELSKNNDSLTFIMVEPGNIYKLEDDEWGLIDTMSLPDKRPYKDYMDKASVDLVHVNTRFPLQGEVFEIKPEEEDLLSSTIYNHAMNENKNISYTYHKGKLKKYNKGKIQKRDKEYQDLVPDIKRYIIDLVEPIQVLELCKTVKCNWKHLLNVNYDFVTQGFAAGNTAKDKFEYLATRVSKNINNQPDIIFVHFNGIPLGKVRFYQVSDEEDDSDDGYIIEDRKEKMQCVMFNLSNHPAIEWIKQDDYNLWIKVLDPNKLPHKLICPPTGKSKHTKIFRDVDLYDYPTTRMKVIKMQTGNEYPGTVQITNEVIKSMIDKLVENDDEKINPMSPDNINEEADMMMMDWNISDIINEYNVYLMMIDDYTRSEAEAFTRAYEKGKFTDNLKRLYNFDVSRSL